MSYPQDPHNSQPPNQQYPPQNGYEDPSWSHEPVDPAAQRERQRLAQEAARHTKAQKLTFWDVLIRGVVFLVVALEVLLGLRFILRLTGANPDNLFARVIYDLSQPFVAPFSTLFISPTLGGNQYIFDVNLLVAMAAYLALLALFLGLIRVFVSR